MGPLTVPAPTADGHAAQRKTVTDAVATRLPLSGGTLTGPLTVPAPTADGHAAQRKYVDDEVAGKANQSALNDTNSRTAGLSRNGNILVYDHGSAVTSEMYVTRGGRGGTTIALRADTDGVSATAGKVKIVFGDRNVFRTLLDAVFFGDVPLVGAKGLWVFDRKPNMPTTVARESLPPSVVVADPQPSVGDEGSGGTHIDIVDTVIALAAKIEALEARIAELEAAKS